MDYAKYTEEMLADLFPGRAQQAFPELVDLIRDIVESGSIERMAAHLRIMAEEADAELHPLELPEEDRAIYDRIAF